MPRFARPFLPTPANARRRRSGCLGCFPQVLLALLMGAVVVLLTTAVFAPWGYFLGGSFHIIPYWHGWGVLHAKNGNYAVYVMFQPRPSGSKIMPGPSVGGTGYLCSPRGEIFYMHLGGGMRRGIGTNTDGEKINFYMNHWPRFFGGFTNDHRPSIELRGQWNNPNIAMDDHGSISRAFNADGAVDRGHSNKPYPGDITPVTLIPGSYSDFEAACKASH
jgi:hypothetical protein